MSTTKGWGTCADCPRDPRGIPYPDRCAHTSRYDHNLPWPETCPFCSKLSTIFSDAHAMSFLDQYPLSPGHTLVVSARHVESICELTDEEYTALWREVHRVIADLQIRHDLDGFNIGVNDGKAAGQTVPHVHVHVIPRYDSDVEDPRGGIRWVLPEKAKYWT